MIKPEERRNLYNPWSDGIRKKAEALLREGHNCREVHDQISVPESTLRTWRAGIGLPPHCRAAARREFIAEHAHEQTDAQMSTLLGIHPRTVAGIRKGLGLEAFVARARSLGPDDYEVIALLASRGHTQQEIGTLLGAHQTVVSRYMDEYKIKPCNRELKPVRSWAKVRFVVE